jgi:transcriptional regulator with XRE-family HTH domain
MPIDANRLRELRRRKGWTQAKLAENAGKLNPQTIYKAEKKGLPNPRPETLAKLVRALGYSPEVLAGTAPLPPVSKAEEDRNLEKSYPELRLRVSGETRNAYSLVAQRYGVSVRMIVNLAPVLFAIMAERSLRQRAAALEELKKQAQALEKAAEPLPHMGWGVWRTEERDDMIFFEERSIKERDIFAETTRSHAANLDSLRIHDNIPQDPGDEYFAANPFAMFARADAMAVGLDVCETYEDDTPVQIDLPDEIKSLAGDDSELVKALSAGWILVRDIPPDLMQPKRTADRVAWLRERLKTDEYASRQKWLSEQPRVDAADCL